MLDSEILKFWLQTSQLCPTALYAVKVSESLTFLCWYVKARPVFLNLYLNAAPYPYILQRHLHPQFTSKLRSSSEIGGTPIAFLAPWYRTIELNSFKDTTRSICNIKRSSFWVQSPWTMLLISGLLFLPECIRTISEDR